MSYANNAVLASAEKACIKSVEGAVVTDLGTIYDAGNVAQPTFNNLCTAVDLDNLVGRDMPYKSGSRPTEIDGLWAGQTSGESGSLDMTGIPTCTGDPLPPLGLLSRQWGPYTDILGTDHYFQIVLDDNGLDPNIVGSVLAVMLTGVGEITNVVSFSSECTTRFGLSMGADSVEVVPTVGAVPQTVATALVAAANGSVAGDFANTQWFRGADGHITGWRNNGTAPITASLYVVLGLADGQPDTVSAVTDFNDTIKASDVPWMKFDNDEDVLFTPS